MFKRFTAVVLASLVASTLLGATPASATHDNGKQKSNDKRCQFGNWRNEVNGKPAGLRRGSAQGFYLWHTDGGWKLYVTHPGQDKVNLTGTITSQGGDIHGVSRRFESNDTVTTIGRRQLSFDLNNYGGLDGLEFRTKCAPSIALDLWINGAQALTQQVFVGRAATNPATVPFIESRTKPLPPVPAEPKDKEKADEGRNCRFGRWPSYAQGRPRGFQRGSAEGFYLWHNDRGWHLFVTHQNHPTEVAVSGTVTSGGRMFSVQQRFESNDSLTHHGNNAISFDLRNYGGLDGVQLRTKCARNVSFNLFIRGVPAPVSQVYIGSAGTHPATMPFGLSRQKR